jgi:hypothetical protein
VTNEGEESALDLETRDLCPDGACIGVLGADGRCGECGRSATGGPDEERPRKADLAEAQADPDFDSDRELCPDGACIGVLGSDGRCRECGRSGA